MNAPPDPQLATPVIHTELLRVLLDADHDLPVQTLLTAIGSKNHRELQRELDRLRDAGCELHENPQHGLHLVQAGLGCWADYLRWMYDHPRIVEVYQKTASTQDAARRLIRHRGDASEGAWVMADVQTAGRGRLGRRWIAPAGTSLTFSRISQTTTPDDAQAINRLTFATSVAVAQALDDWLVPNGFRTQIKWPNDVLVDGRKIAGILVEVMHQVPHGHFAIIGVGLNVNLLPEHLPDDPKDPQLRNRITSLVMHNILADRLAVLARVVAEMDQALDHADPNDLLSRWRDRSTLIGHPIRLQSDGRTYEGEVADLDPNLGLILRTSTGNMIHLPAATTTVLI